MFVEKRYKIDNVCDSKYLIYAILDPITQSTVYIGKSSSGLKRPKSHFYDSSLKRKSPLTNWIEEQFSLNQTPIICVLETTKYVSKLNTLERYYIREALDEEGVLKNLTLGGGGITGHKRSEESKQKMRNKYKGIRPSDLCMEMNIKSKIGKPLKTEHKNKLRKSSAKAIKILCLNNKKIYDSSRHAKEDLSEIKCHKDILRAVRTGQSIKNYYFSLA